LSLGNKKSDKINYGSEEELENFRPNFDLNSIVNTSLKPSLRIKSVSPDLIPFREAYGATNCTPTYQIGKHKLRKRNQFISEPQGSKTQTPEINIKKIDHVKKSPRSRNPRIQKSVASD